MSEAYLSRQIYNYAKSKGCMVAKIDASHRGWPDRIIIKNGKCIFIEVKNPNGKGRVSKLQEYIIGQLSEHGVDVYIVNSIKMAKVVIDSL